MDEIYNLSPTKSYTAADILESVINPSSLSSTIQEEPNNLTRQNGSATSPEYYDVSSDDEPAHSSKIGNVVAGSQSAKQDGARKAESNSDSEIEEVKVIAETNNALPDLEFEEIDEKDTPVVEKPEDTVKTVNNSDVDNAETKRKSAFDKYCDNNIYEVEEVCENGKDAVEARPFVIKNNVSDTDFEEVSDIVAEKIEENGEVFEVKNISDSGCCAVVTTGEVAKENGSELLCEEMEVDGKICEGDAAIGSPEVNVAEVENNLYCYSQKTVDESTGMSVGMEVKSLAKLCREAVGSTTDDLVDASQDDIVPLAVECVIDEGDVDFVAQGEDSAAVGDGLEIGGKKVDVAAAQEGVEGGENVLKSEDGSQVKSVDVLTADAAKVEPGESAVITPKKKLAKKRPATDSERKSSRKVSFTKIDSGWELAAKKPKRKSAGGASPKSVAAKSPAKTPSKKLTTPVKKVSQEATPVKDTWLKPFHESPNFYVGPVVLPVLQPVLTLDRIEKFFYKAMLVGKSSQLDRSSSYNKASTSYNRSRNDDPPMEESGHSTRHMMGPASRRAEASSPRKVIAGPASKKMLAGPASKKVMAGPASKKVMAGPASKKVMAGPASKKVMAGPASKKMMAGPASKKVAAGPASKKVEAASASRKMIACPASRKAQYMARMASPPMEVGRSLRRRH